MEEGGRKLAAFFSAAQRRRRYFVELDPNVENSADCIRISRHSGWDREDVRSVRGGETGKDNKFASSIPLVGT